MGRGGKVCCRVDPLDFDASRLRVRKFLIRQIKVRIMLPMSIVCNTCGNHIRQGTKLHSRKEEVAGETPLVGGIKRFRFYFKCTECSAVLTIKTHPQQDPRYVVESGATRSFEPLTPRRDSEPWRKQDEVSSEAEEMGDVTDPLQMQSSTPESKREMVPDELNSMKKSKDFVRRIEDEDFEDEEDLTQPCASNDESWNNAFKKRKFSEEFSDEPTDSLTKAITSDISNDREKTIFSNEFLDKPTDSLTKATSSDILSDGGNHVGSRDQSYGKLLSNSSSVRIAVVKKAGPTSSPSSAL